MQRSRLSFILLIAASIAILFVAGIFTFRTRIADWLQPSSVVPTAAQLAAPTPVAAATTTPKILAQATSAPLPTAAQTPATTALTTTTATKPSTVAQLTPIWGPNYKAGDGLGTLVCGAYAFSGDYPLQQIQMQGLDVKRGFHLGIVPFYLNENYIVTAKERIQAMRDGKIDCLLTTFDLFALEDPGTITAFINESAGADQLMARNLKTLNDLKGKRIAFEANGPSEFFVLDLLNTVKITPSEVTLVPVADQNTAIKTFNDNQADVVAGWTPVINGAKTGGGAVLASSKDFRSILGAIVMSPQAMDSKKTVIQLFHDAWFEAVGQQEKDFEGSAKAIASWGHNDFLGVSADKAGDDLRTLLGGVAQANLTDNARAFAKVSSVIDRLLKTRQLWAAAGHTMPNSDVTKLVDPQFVQASAAGLQLDLAAPNQFVNSTFSLGRDQIVASKSATTNVTTAAGTATPQTAASISVPIATLPCTRFEFIPNSVTLQPASQTDLRNCAVDVLKQNLGLLVRVRGSSAWPGPKGAIQRSSVESTAKERAQSVVDYLVTQGISKERFVVEWTMPPEDHWETTDVAKQAKDRFVEITLLASGL